MADIFKRYRDFKILRDTEIQMAAYIYEVSNARQKKKRLELKTLDLTSVTSSPVLNSQGFFKITSMLIKLIGSGKTVNRNVYVKMTLHKMNNNLVT